MSKKNTKQLPGGAWISGIAMLVIVVAINVFSGDLAFRADLTKDKLYTLSDGSINILSKLDRDVTIQLYVSGAAEEIPYYAQYASRVRDLLKEYQLASGSHIIIEEFDPKADSDEELWARNYGIQGQQIPGKMDGFYLGLVAISGDKNAAVPMLNPNDETKLEYTLSRIITEVTTSTKQVIGVISSIPVLGRQGMPFAMPGQPQQPTIPPFGVFQELRQQYDMREIQAPVAEIPQDVSALLIIHPKMLDPGTLFSIDQFVLKGGNIMVMVDPASLFEAMQQQQQQSPFGRPPAPNVSSTLDPLFTAWGINYSDSLVIADPEAIMGNGQQFDQMLTYLALSDKNIDQNDPLSAGINKMLLLTAGALRVTPSKDVKVTTLIKSSEKANTLSRQQTQMGPDMMRRQFTPGISELPVAVRLVGSFKTAFPDGSPADKPDPTAPAPIVTPVSTHIRVSVHESSITVIADTDFIYDDLCYQRTPFGLMPQDHGNAVFFANAVEQMTGNTDLISIRSRGITDRSFDRVTELVQNASTKLSDASKQVDEQQEVVRKRLSELQVQTEGNTRRILLTPEAQKEFEALQQQQRDLAKRRRELSNELRKDVASLGNDLKAINILAIPALIVLLGLGFYAYRRSHTR